MCPACLMNVAIAAAGATSTGGLAAVFLKKFYFKKRKTKSNGKSKEESKCHK